jgi:hypothetical protein
LSHLAADGTAADDNQSLGQFRQRKQRLVGEVAGILQAWDGQFSGTCTRGDNGLLEMQRLVSDDDRIAACESTLAKEDVDPKFTKPFRRIMRTDRGSQSSHALHDFGKVNIRRRRLNSVVPGVAYRCCLARSGDQSFGRNAADVQAIASHQAAFDQCDLGT